MIMMQYVITVDTSDRETGIMEKIKAHELGVLHRAFSVFIFNSRNQMLLQQRAHEKYHGGGLWTNTCCSHPLPGENVQQGADRRLAEEMGMACRLRPEFSFIYKARVENGLTEHELDHVFIGYTDQDPVPDAAEVRDWKWVDMEWLLEDVSQRPELYTVWFKIMLPRLLPVAGIQVLNA